MLNDIPLPNAPGNIDNWQGSRLREGGLLELLAARRRELQRQLEDVRALRPVQGESLPAEPDRRAASSRSSGSNRYGMSIAGDAVWIMSNKTTLNVRGSFYNMTDEFYNPSLAARRGRAAPTTGRTTVVLVALQQRLCLLSGARRDVRHRHGDDQPARPAGPRVVPASRCVDGVGAHEPLQGRHNMKWGGEMRAYFGEAARFEPINLVFNSALTANSSDTPDVANYRQPVGDVHARRARQRRPRRASCRCRRRTCAAMRPTSRTTANVERSADAERRICAGSTSRARPIRLTGSRSGSI